MAAGTVSTSHGCGGAAYSFVTPAADATCDQNVYRPGLKGGDMTPVLNGLTHRMKELGCATFAVLQEGLDTRMVAVCDEPARMLDHLDGISYDARLDCLALDGQEFDTLIRDTLGNDVKHVLHTGIMMMGSSPALSGDTVPPEPIGITRSELDYNMERHGFSLILMEDMEKTRIIRPEYVIAGAMFSRDPRRIFSGIPVMLCNGGINYGLLTYLARRYLFEETLLGIIQTLRDAGRLADIADGQIKIMELRGVAPYVRAKASILDALGVYEC